MYFFFSVIYCMLNEWSLYKSAHTGLPYRTPLGSGSSSLGLFACSFSNFCWCFPLIFHHDLHSTTSAECEAGTSQEMAAKMNRNGLKNNNNNNKKETHHTECRMLNVELKEGECTRLLSCHLNWNKTWTLNPKHTSAPLFYPSCHPVLQLHLSMSVLS